MSARVTIHKGITGSKPAEQSSEPRSPSEEVQHLRPQQTRWIAIAGAPSSGKTTTVEALSAALGCPTIPDFPRQVIRDMCAEGKTPEQVLQSGAEIQSRMLERILPFYDKQTASSRLVADYGLPCHYAWHKVYDLVSPQDLVVACDRWRYEHVFMMAPLPLINDAERFDDDVRQAKAAQEIEKAYRYFGYNVVPVPRFSHDNPDVSIARRVDFILDCIAGGDAVDIVATRRA